MGFRSAPGVLRALAASAVAVACATLFGACTDNGSDDGGQDASVAPSPDGGARRDAGPDSADTGMIEPGDADTTPDATLPDLGPYDTGTGPIRIQQESNTGLPGCYRCGIGAADFDGDGFVDLVMAGAFDSAWSANMGSYTFNNVIRVYRNVSVSGQHIAFELVQEIPDAWGGGGALVRIGDFDGDGRPDFAVQFRDGITPFSDTSAWINTGGFQFVRRPLAVSFDTNSTSMGMAAADLDGDGRDDLVFNSDGQGYGPGLWYRFHPAGDTWEAMQTDFSHKISYGGTIAAGDLDGDGLADIIVGGNSNFPFGNYDCSVARIYGEIHMNRGPADPGINPNASAPLGKFALRSDRQHPPMCTGMDNAGVMIADVDGDGHQDVIISGSTDAFQGPPGLNGVHYDFVVLRNVDGTGDNFVTWETAGQQLDNGTTNAGSGSVDFPNIAVGDLNGDGFPEIFVQGHHRNYLGDVGSYVFDSRLFLNVGGVAFEEQDLHLPDVSEGGQAMADFDNDGLVDLIFAGATIPFHSNGNNPTDHNDASTIFTYVYRNVRGQAP